MGAWTLSDKHTIQKGAVGKPARIIYGTNPLLGEIVVGHFIYGQHDANEEAARLIAAAPELAEALRAICDGACWSLSGKRSHIAEIPAAKIEAARAALSKSKAGY
jgi:hypothetical protein